MLSNRTASLLLSSLGPPYLDLPGESGNEALDVRGDRLAHPALGLGVRHPVAPEQHLLVLQRHAGDLPADHQVLEQHLLTAAPGVVLRARRGRRSLPQLADRPRAQRLAEDEDVALVVDVVDRGHLGARPTGLLRLRALGHLSPPPWVGGAHACARPPGASPPDAARAPPGSASSPAAAAARPGLRRSSRPAALGSAQRCVPT